MESGLKERLQKFAKFICKVHSLNLNKNCPMGLKIALLAFQTDTGNV